MSIHTNRRSSQASQVPPPGYGHPGSSRRDLPMPPPQIVPVSYSMPQQLSPDGHAPSLFSSAVSERSPSSVHATGPSTISVRSQPRPSASWTRPGQQSATRYSFRTVGFNSMVMEPIPASEDQIPSYFIEVALNCFNPTSFITTIWYGSSREEGSWVGEFELGISAVEGRVNFHGEHRMSDVFKRLSGSRFSAHTNVRNWEWNRGPHVLHWEEITRDHRFDCFRGGDRDKKKYLARLLPRVPGASSTTTLEVSDTGHELLEDILLSALLVERKRQSPMDSNKNDKLFN
ncbi:unnamed protein product [Somion occarium]|uniref:DUF6593 domain-containing protein n=1 Tax=Somion occarium TaxID=3059160 RepID=A0ABP1CKG8_9APHY